MTDPDRARDRAKSVMSEFADQIDVSDDAWALTRSRMNDVAVRRRTHRWTIGIVATAAVAMVAVFAVTALNDGDGSTRDASVAAPDDSGADAYEPGFVALDIYGRLRNYDTAGVERNVIADTNWRSGGEAAPPIFSISPDGTVYFESDFPAVCANTDSSVDSLMGAFITRILSVPLEGGEPECVVSNAWSPAISPDGKTLAFVTDPNGDIHATDDPGVPRDLVLATLNIESGEVHYWPRSYFANGSGAVVDISSPMAWSPDGQQIALSLSFGDVAGSGSRVVSIIDVPPDPAGGESDDATAVVVTRRPSGWYWEGGGPALTYPNDEQLIVASTPDEPGVLTVVSSSGLRKTALPDPEDQTSVVLQEATRILDLSTLPGPNAPGLLITTTTVDAEGTAPGTAGLYDFTDSPSRLMSDVVAAAWIPGTTASDLP